MKFHHCRDHHATRELEFSYVSTKQQLNNLADIMTKALGTEKHRGFMEGYSVSKLVVVGHCLLTRVELVLFCPLAAGLFPTRFFSLQRF